MGTSARDRLLQSVDELTGNPGDCAEAVLVQSRSRWATPAPFLVGMPVFVVGLLVGLPGALAGILAATLLGLSFARLTSMWVLARTSGGVVLATSGKRPPKAIEIAKELTYPLPVEVKSTRVLRKVVVDGELYFLTRSLIDRFDSVVGRPE